jgi:hypothetical protein
MRRRVLAFVLAGAFAAAVAAPPSSAQYVQEAPGQPEKKLTPQQEKLKKCGAEWQEMKKQGKTQGLTWAAFRRECLKRT